MPSENDQLQHDSDRPDPADHSLPPAPRFACPSLEDAALSEAVRDAEGRIILTLDPDQSRHAVRTLRLSAGDEVGLLDGRGKAAWAVIKSAHPKAAACAVVRIVSVPLVTPKLTLATAIPKGPRGDAIVNDLAQLGVDVLVPMQTQHSIVHPSDAKLLRYHRASVEAAKQSGRARFMEIAPLTPFETVLSQHAKTDLKLIADLDGQSANAFADRVTKADSAVILIGPEGGFAPGEIDAAQRAGFIPWRFSKNTLRIETAGAAAVAILRSMD